ncbi:hypothetical protein TNCV_3479141 [Trichonephila clavipes]|nr:hypothetical protein TNCV_3479141 [Trichonephila clavipes]
MSSFLWCWVTGILETGGVMDNREGGERRETEREGGKEKREETAKEEKRSLGERERSPPCMEKRAVSGDWSVKDDERRWR